MVTENELTPSLKTVNVSGTGVHPRPQTTKHSSVPANNKRALQDVKRHSAQSVCRKGEGGEVGSVVKIYFYLQTMTSDIIAAN